jgi:hypothetical protein
LAPGLPDPQSEYASISRSIAGFRINRKDLSTHLFQFFCLDVAIHHGRNQNNSDCSVSCISEIDSILDDVLSQVRQEISLICDNEGDSRSGRHCQRIRLDEVERAIAHLLIMNLIDFRP